MLLQCKGAFCLQQVLRLIVGRQQSLLLLAGNGFKIIETMFCTEATGPCLRTWSYFWGQIGDIHKKPLLGVSFLQGSAGFPFCVVTLPNVLCIY